ncbi:MAG: MBL fold metallo-hydrolase [Promethearchaeota archaeon]
MTSSEDWYEVVEHKDYLYVIRERLDELDPRFYTSFVNIYLLLGSEKALLIDTGCGLFPLKPIVDEIIGTRKLLVVNSHFHFDHRGANDEFPEIYIHESEKNMVSLPLDMSYVKDSSKELVNEYSKKDFILKPSLIANSLKEGDEFDLGGLKVKVFHTPGHSMGSISLLTDKGDLFTGDTAHYGAMYLPKRRQFSVILDSLSKLLVLFNDSNVQEIYPSHEEYPVGKELLEKLYEGIINIENIWDIKTKDRFLSAWILEDENFKYIV